MIKFRRLALLMSLAAWVSSWAIAPAGAQYKMSERTRAIGKKLKCMCGHCEDSAATCSMVGGAFSGPCGASARPMLEKIDEGIAKGESDDLILQSFVQQYGQQVFIEPPHTGIGSLAWAMPVVYLVLGTGLVVVVMNRWRKRAPQPATTSGPSTGRISPEALERARQRVAQDTED